MTNTTTPFRLEKTVSGDFAQGVASPRSLSCSGLFDPPQSTEYTFLSLGAGVQSSCLALMAAKGEITPMPDAAIFADTQAEPASVYRWLDWLETQLPFPVVRVSRGDLTAESLKINPFKSDPQRSWVKALIPAFLQNPDGTKSLMGRQCTFRYKVEMLEKTSRRLAGIKRGQKKVTVTQWIGISWDELQRMKLPRKPWVQHRWPLIEKRMTRHHCLEWVKSNGYPEPPRSACIYCPFHTNAQWRRMKDEEPQEFERAVKFERDLEAVMKATNQKAVKPFLHASLIPLDQVDLSTDTERGQGAFDFQAECEGMCGV